MIAYQEPPRVADPAAVAAAAFRAASPARGEESSSIALLRAAIDSLAADLHAIKMWYEPVSRAAFADAIDPAEPRMAAIDALLSHASAAAARAHTNLVRVVGTARPKRDDLDWASAAEADLVRLHAFFEREWLNWPRLDDGDLPPAIDPQELTAMQSGVKAGRFVTREESERGDQPR